MSRLLLDTHALLWWLTGNDAMSDSVRDEIAHKSNNVGVSAATAWEIATKVQLGKLAIASEIVQNFSAYLEQSRFIPLPITVRHAIRAGLLPRLHRDPFDRILIAQALEEDMIVVSDEKIFEGYGVTRLW